MKNKIFALLLFALALTSIATIPNDKENTLWLLAMAAFFMFFGFRVWKGKSKVILKNEKVEYSAQTNNTTKRTDTAIMQSKSESDEIVFITKEGGKYHQHDGCMYLHGIDAIEIRRRKAIKDGYRPCKQCYPYGD